MSLTVYYTARLLNIPFGSVGVAQILFFLPTHARIAVMYTLRQRYAIFIAACMLVIVALLVVKTSITKDGAEDQIQQCGTRGSTASSTCYTIAITKILRERGLPAALDAVANAAKKDKYFSDHCHNTMHDIGKASYDLYVAGTQVDLTGNVSYCNYGFFHGFMETMYAQTKSLAGAKKFCDTIGTQLSRDKNATSNCYHGIGHGVVDGYDISVWGDARAMVAPGLSMCHAITTDSEFLRSCEMGAFNSIELMYPDPKYKLKMPDDPYQLCMSGYDTNETLACILEMSVLVRDIARGDYAKAFHYTDTVSPAFRYHAVKTVALYSVSERSTADAPIILDICRKIESGYQHECMEGVVAGLLVFGGANDKYRLAITFCQNETLSENDKQACAEAIVHADTYTPQARAEVCKLLPTSLMPRSCKPQERKH